MPRHSARFNWNAFALLFALSALDSRRVKQSFDQSHVNLVTEYIHDRDLLSIPAGYFSKQLHRLSLVGGDRGN
jgi:hypothetical protein